MTVDVERSRAAAPVQQPAAPRPSRGAGAIPHFPGLEGLRGLAVVAVVAYHAQYQWMRGGFLGVSTFFTLSGFLITSLLLNERGATGTIDLRQFWRRRFRRLMPAALAALTLVVAFGWLAADDVQRRNLAGDVLAALAYAANWRFLFAHQSYADIFGAASPVAHFWSLAIEEQFYLLLPFVAWFLLVRLRGARIGLGLVFALLTAGSLALTLLGGLSADATYYHTGTRAAELLIGALMAVAVFDRRITRPLGRNRVVQAIVSLLGIVALVVSVAAWSIVDHAGEASPWLYRGGFAAYSLLTVVVILATVTPAGPVRWLLSLWPLRFLGKISYGVYLYHWPIFLWLDANRTGLEDPALSGVRLSATVALAIVSYYVLESPIRHASKTAKPRLGRFAVPVVAGLAAAVVAVTITAPEPVIDFDSASEELAAAASGAGAAARLDTRQAEPPFPRISFFGDSTAMMTGIGMTEWNRTAQRFEQAGSVARMGCGIGRGGQRRNAQNKIEPLPDICNRWELEFRNAIENGQPNIAVVQIGPWEVADRQLEGSDRWVAPGDPDYDRYMLDEMVRAVEVLSSNGAMVVWLSAPRMDPRPPNTDEMLEGTTADPARMDRLNELIRELPGKLPGKVEIVDLAGWLESVGDEDERLRDDGIHFSKETGAEVAERFLGDAVISTYQKMWRERAADPEALAAGPGDDRTEDITRYLNNRYKVLLVGDRSAELVGEGLSKWAKETGALEVTTAIRPDCGMLRTTAREGPSKARAPTPPECQEFRRWVLDTTEAVKPDFVLVVPSAWDLGPVQLSESDSDATWGDTVFDQRATVHYKEMTRQLNDLRSAVLWANVPTAETGRGGAGAAAKVLPAAADQVAERYDAAIEAIAESPPKPHGLLRIDLANWASRHVPALEDGSDLTVETKMALGEWLAREAYISYDGIPLKLRPPSR